MIIKYIKVKNFLIFEKEQTFWFDPLTMVKGSNGSGKSTLIVDSLLFTLFGYSKKSLSEVPTKGTKSCTVEIKLELNSNVYVIKRQYPTKIHITENDTELKFVNSKDAQNYLTKLFKNTEYFRKFRMVDTIDGVNILEEGKASLNKTLLSLQQSNFNNIRQNLLNIKKDREVYNKDKLGIVLHYPSEKRLKVLQDSYNAINDEYRAIKAEKDELNSNYISLTNQKCRGEENLSRCKRQRDKLLTTEKCFVCNQTIQKTDQTRLLKDLNNEIININESIKSKLDIIEDLKEVIQSLESDLMKKLSKKEKIYRLKTILDNRIKQKSYKYSTKDVVIVKKAIEELDNFYSYYLTQWVKGLEPIINSVLEKINFQLNFELDEKNNFDIKLFKDNQEFGYKDLSNGQKLILSIAFKIALLLEKNEQGLIVADEGFSSLDDENLGHILTLFQNIPFQLICVIHRYEDRLGIKVIDLNEEKL